MSPAGGLVPGEDAMVIARILSASLIFIGLVLIFGSAALIILELVNSVRREEGIEAFNEAFLSGQFEDPDERVRR